MRLEMGETSRGDVSILKDASLVWLEAPVLVAPHLEEAPFAEFYGDIMMGSDNPRIEHTDPICSELFDSTPHFIPFIPHHPSFMHAFHEFLGDI